MVAFQDTILFYIFTAVKLNKAGAVDIVGVEKPWIIFGFELKGATAASKSSILIIFFECFFKKPG